jgi:hypothetical protein
MHQAICEDRDFWMCIGKHAGECTRNSINVVTALEESLVYCWLHHHCEKQNQHDPIGSVMLGGTGTS